MTEEIKKKVLEEWINKEIMTKGMKWDIPNKTTTIKNSQILALRDIAISLTAQAIEEEIENLMENFYCLMPEESTAPEVVAVARSELSKIISKYKQKEADGE